MLSGHGDQDQKKKKIKEVSFDAVHPQSKYGSTHANLWVGTAIPLEISAPNLPIFTPGTY